MRHYLNIFVLSVMLLLFVYDFFTKKLSNGTKFDAKFFRAVVYIAAVLAVYQAINFNVDKID